MVRIFFKDETFVDIKKDCDRIRLYIHDVHDENKKVTGVIVL
jgi:hypothetical protein